MPIATWVRDGQSKPVKAKEKNNENKTAMPDGFDGGDGGSSQAATFAAVKEGRMSETPARDIIMEVDA